MPDLHDLLAIDGELSAGELAVRDRIRRFVRERVAPNIADWYEFSVFPTELIGEMAQLGLLGMELSGHGCAGGSAVEFGLAMQELEAGDSSLRAFVSAHGTLAMGAIAKHGSDAQQSDYLPVMARGEQIGCFALAEPGAAGDLRALQTVAVRDGDDWIVTGTKRWVGPASIADLAIVWASTDDGVRGFIVPTRAAGCTVRVLEPKISMRASIQCEISLDRVRVPGSARLPGATGIQDALECVDDARYGIAWGVLGAARDSFEVAARYAAECKQHGQSSAGFQLTQQKLVDMAIAIQHGQLLALHLGRKRDAGTLEPHMISLAKLSSVRAASEVCRTARGILGGNGILLDHSPMRHASNLESVRTSEGTDEVHTLTLGERLTGIRASQ